MPQHRILERFLTDARQYLLMTTPDTNGAVQAPDATPAAVSSQADH